MKQNKPQNVKPDIKPLLSNWDDDNGDALNQLIPVIYDELYKMAAKCLSKETSYHTLQPTALVNEVYLRLIKFKTVSWQSRAHFFGIASQMMRNILVDYARKRMAGKRIDPKYKISLEDLSNLTETKDLELLTLDDALHSFSNVDPQQSKIVELRFFGGLTIEETAEVMQLSPKIVRQEWEMAKLWLLRELSGKK